MTPNPIGASEMYTCYCGSEIEYLGAGMFNHIDWALDKDHAANTLNPTAQAQRLQNALEEGDDEE